MDGKQKIVEPKQPETPVVVKTKAPSPIIVLQGEIKTTNDLMQKLIETMTTQHSSDKQAIANVIAALDKSGENTKTAVDELFADMNKTLKESNELLKKALEPPTPAPSQPTEETLWKSKPVKIAGGVVLVATAIGLAIYFADEIKDFIGLGKDHSINPDGSGGDIDIS